MSFGLFLPLVLAFVALTEVPLFIRWRANGTISETAFLPMALLSVALPFIAYLVLNFLAPEWGAIEVF